MPLEVYDYTKSEWAVAARRWLDRAGAAIIDGHDAIVPVCAALACLKIEQGIEPPDRDLLDVAKVE